MKQLVADEGDAKAASSLPQRHNRLLCRQPAATAGVAEAVQHQSGQQAVVVGENQRKLKLWSLCAYFMTWTVKKHYFFVFFLNIVQSTTKVLQKMVERFKYFLLDYKNYDSKNYSIFTNSFLCFLILVFFYYHMYNFFQG